MVLPGLTANAQTVLPSFHGKLGAALPGMSLSQTLWPHHTSPIRPDVQPQLLKPQHLEKKQNMLSFHKRISSFRLRLKHLDQSTKLAMTSFLLWVTVSFLSPMTPVKPHFYINVSQ